VIVGLGVDIVAVARIQDLLEREPERFLARTFTAAERDYCLKRGRPAESLAARFAAKEAVMKVLGTGWAEGVGFLQVEVVRDQKGSPGLELSGEAQTRAMTLGITKMHLSLSHTADLAVAVAVAERTP